VKIKNYKQKLHGTGLFFLFKVGEGTGKKKKKLQSLSQTVFS
jgi:hypothetical protein